MTSVTVVIPAYDEGDAFASTLVSIADCFALRRSEYSFKYLIVDDGSRDETHAAAVRFARWRPEVRVLRHERNLGLGAALRTAIREIDTQFAVVLDADLSYSPATAMELIEALEREHADIALASPYMHGGAVRNVSWARRVLSREANRLLSMATGGRYATITCMVRAYRVEALRRLKFRSNGMEAVPEMLLWGLRNRLRVVELPATLEWSHERRASGGRLRVSSVTPRIAATVLMACHHRPALWLALPGLFPGLLPLVVGVLLAFHLNSKSLAIGTTATIVVQYASLALFSGQLAAYFGRKFYHSHQRNGVRAHGYDAPGRTA